ncbi:MAG TPA: phosphopantetheine-binding protein [Burkholderiaceae bacterium]|nr:phosphopantetheine-binding protein [Burkholderiaceae bacterium]
MSTASHVLRLLDETLGLQGRTAQFDAQTPLLGALPELDSMAVVSLITALEEQLGISIGDDEIDGQTFATVGALTRFVEAKLVA